MKSNETKAEFIELRAEGLSYDKITGKLHISKATCCKWQAELSNEIAAREQEHLTELYELYGMKKAARIERLGKTLQQIDEALEQIYFTELTPEQLLNYKLKYEAALKAEYAEPIQIPQAAIEYTNDDILTLTADIYNRLKAGAINDKQAKAELITLDNVKKARGDAAIGFDFIV